jgi:hypothetical protein
VKRGLIKRVGLGATIDVCNDQWIPSNTSLKPPVRLNSANVVLVSDLLHENEKKWHHETDA